jgi:hypothetical protein
LLNSVGIIESKLPFSVAEKKTIHIRIENARQGSVHIGDKLLPYSNGVATVEIEKLQEGDIPISFVNKDGHGYILEPLKLTHDKQIDRGTASPVFVDALCRYVSSTEDRVSDLEKKIAGLESFVYPDDNGIL